MKYINIAYIHRYINKHIDINTYIHTTDIESTLNMKTAIYPMSCIHLYRVETHCFYSQHGRTDSLIVMPFTLLDVSFTGQHENV